MDNKSPCGSCGSVTYNYWKMVAPSNSTEVYEVCNDCSTMKVPNLSPDVYFDSSKGNFQTDPNLCDRKTGPIPFSTKREKAAIMNRLGLREAGDKEHGSRNFDKKSSKQWDGI